MSTILRLASFLLLALTALGSVKCDTTVALIPTLGWVRFKVSSSSAQLCIQGWPWMLGRVGSVEVHNIQCTDSTQPGTFTCVPQPQQSCTSIEGCVLPAKAAPEACYTLTVRDPAVFKGVKSMFATRSRDFGALVPGVSGQPNTLHPFGVFAPDM
ncbi:uncharacterized protein PFL1_05956 [Pseudozyma flocculosa PF-1]|uniref:Uncharacterized protein n=2 Tax=Pseudozyma flocculosa TaxID=84751 RepID=A0A5C3F4N5_9BASI|nr:uncharacterized protein PFL1_05956 [Pseudozyma flocculosa PF-1]EPQ26635.1 hypothetical protein PFL1_05956 [Pseudozyma flocculosa PF-1]SPO38369.1 uncharacterized protein PSFLO_03846 [Pseudozyma flocculosa]